MLNILFDQSVAFYYIFKNYNLVLKNVIKTVCIYNFLILSFFK